MSFNTITNKFGRTYEINSADNFWNKVLSSGIFQVNNLRKLHELCPNARTVLDIGANIGSNTIEYATWANEVHSFEPTPALYSQLVKNISLNEDNPDTNRWHKDQSMKRKAKINTHQVAVGDKAGVVHMKTYDINAGKNYVTANKTENTISVDVITIDSMNFTDVDIMKIDVEGYELFVLNGADQTIKKYRPVIQTEISPSYLQRNGCTVQQLAEWFYERNYKAVDRFGKEQSKQFPTDYEGRDFFWIPQ
jgi:FkbM family methyltransferase